MMRKRLAAGVGCAFFFMLLAGAEVARGQEACADGREALGWIGAYAFHCPGGSCLYERLRGDQPRAFYEFSSEPRLRAIDSGGPGAGLLRDGDVLVAVNGYLITGQRGGRELANLPVGEPARLTVRRDDRLEEITVTPKARCEPAMVLVGNTRVNLPLVAPAPAASTEPGSAARAPRATGTNARGPVPNVAAVTPGTGVGPMVAATSPPVPDAFGVSSGPGSLGMAFSCSDCSFTFGDDADFSWATPQFLRVEAVTEGGAAAAAGLEAGDVLTHVNGHSLKSDEGGRLIFRNRAGDVLSIRYERDGHSFETTLRVQGGGGLRREGGVSLLSDASQWGSVVGRLAEVIGSGTGGPGLSGSVLTGGSTLTITGEHWGPDALGAVFAWCDECSWVVEGDLSRWVMKEYPVVAGVRTGGPAEQADLRVGDVLTHVDGLDMKTEDAARRFLNARDGDRLQLRYRRGGVAGEITLVAGSARTR